MKRLFTTTIESPKADWAILLLRLCLGLLMVTHGYDKLQTFLAGGSDFPDPFGVGGRASMGLTIFAEFFCSILLVLGLFTRFALVPLIICMVVIIFVIQKNAPLGEREHAIMYLIPYISLMLTGAGAFSLDNFIFQRKLEE